MGRPPAVRRTRASHRAWDPLFTAGTISLALLAHPREAVANGRFPSAGQIAAAPGGATLVQATFGLLVGAEGAAGAWVCEQAVGYAGEQDPPIAITSEALLVAPFEGLRRSADGGCSWSATEGALAEGTTTDVTTDPSEPARVYGVRSPPTGAGISIVARSDDHGASFVELAVLGDDLLTLTIEVAPSEPGRIVVSALAGAAFEPVLLVSDDAGASWVRRPLGTTGAPFVSAIDPLDADRVYVRLDREGDDALWVTNDGGETGEVAVTATGAMPGFALSPDGASVVIGGPAFGVRVAPASTLAFVDAARIDVRCLRWMAAGLLACVDPTTGAVLARSTDGGATFEPLVAAGAVAPLVCAAETNTGDVCPAAWPAVASLLRAAGGAGGEGEGGEAPAPPEAPEEGGCRASPGAPGAPTGALVMLAALAMTIAMRRKPRPPLG